MKKTYEQECAKKKNGGFTNFILFLLLITGIGFAAGKVLEYFRKSKYSVANVSSEIKHYFGFASALKLSHVSEVISGIVATLWFGAYSVELTDCELKEDAFVSVKSHFSAIRIVVPENVNVIVDGLYNKSVVINSTDGSNEDDPKLYIALKTDFSAIKIERATTK